MPGERSPEASITWAARYRWSPLFQMPGKLLRVHQDFSRSAKLQAQVDSGEVPPLADSAKETFKAAQSLSAQLSNLKLLRQAIKNADAVWTTPMLKRLRKGDQDEVLRLLESLGTELGSAVAERKQFLARPVTVPEDIDQNAELVEGIQNLAQGKRPFSLASLFSKRAEKKTLDSIRIVRSTPSGQEDWQHVLNYVLHLRQGLTCSTMDT
jgi:hypothetical protein